MARIEIRTGNLFNTICTIRVDLFIIYFYLVFDCSRVGCRRYFFRRLYWKDRSTFYRPHIALKHTLPAWDLFNYSFISAIYRIKCCYHIVIIFRYRYIGGRLNCRNTVLVVKARVFLHQLVPNFKNNKNFKISSIIILIDKNVTFYFKYYYRCQYSLFKTNNSSKIAVMTYYYIIRRFTLVKHARAW